MKDYNIPKQQCPYCGYKMDTSLSPFSGGKPPTPGCISICLNCGKAGVFGDDLRCRKPTDDEKEEILKNDKVIITQMAIANINKPDLRKGR